MEAIRLWSAQLLGQKRQYYDPALPSCRACQSFKIYTAEAIDGQFQLHHRNFAALQNSAETCPCKIILKATSESSEALVPSAGPIFLVVHRGRTKSVRGGVCCGPSTMPIDLGTFGIYAEPDSRALTSMDVLLMPPGTPDGLDRVSKWMEVCETQHPNCITVVQKLGDADHEQARLPTRVIDVGPCDGTCDPLLMESNGRRGYYLALSHCWGRANILKTELSCLEDFREHIPFHKLCRNFQHAISITRRLGYRYLWIDSLCIIQDSAEDWAQESAQMSFIYLHSTLTLVASVAQDGEVGFLHKRPALEAGFVRLPYIDETGIRAGDYLISPRLETWENLSDRCVLSTRGWTLQESILSPRKLLFGKDQMHWECQEHAWDETDTLFVHNPFNNSRPMDLPKLLTDMTQSYKSIFNQYNSWYLLVSKYSRRHLTFKEDKFPAIQGLAGLIQRYLGCHYAAGLWEEDLPYGLLWSSLGQTSTQASSLRAPTWSWASLDSPIEYTLERRGVSIIEISDIKFDQEESDIEHSGRTIRGTIVLTGLLQRVRIRTGLLQTNYFTIFHHPVMDMAGNIVGEAIIDTIEMMNTLREKDLFGLLVLTSALNPRIATSLLLRKTEESSTFSRVGIFSNERMLDFPFPNVDLFETSSKERVTLI